MCYFVAQRRKQTQLLVEAATIAREYKEPGRSATVSVTVKNNKKPKNSSLTKTCCVQKSNSSKPQLARSMTSPPLNSKKLVSVFYLFNNLLFS